MRRLSIILSLIFCLIAGQAWAASIVAKEGYYKTCTESDCNDHCGDSSGWTSGDLQAAITQAGSPGSVGICPGTYEATELDAAGGCATEADNLDIYGTTGTATDVILDGTGIDYHVFFLIHDICTLKDLTLANADNACQNLLVSLASDQGVVTNVIFSGGDQSLKGNGQTIFNRCIFDGATDGTSVIDLVHANTDVDFNYCHFKDMGSDIRITDGAVDFNNCLFTGFYVKTIESGADNGQAVNYTNCIFAAGNGYGSSNAYIIDNSAGGTSVHTLTNSLINPNPWNGDNRFTNGVTDGGNNVGLSSDVSTIPQFRSDRYESIVVFMLDDRGNLGDWKDLADEAATRGWGITMALDTLNATAQDYSDLATYIANGHDVACHARADTDLTDKTAMTVTHATATMTISVSRDSPLNDSSTWTGTFSLSTGESGNLHDASYDTVQELCTYINGLADYTCSLNGQTSISTPTVSLTDITNQALAGGHDVKYNTDAFHHTEITEPKETIEANISGFTVTGFVYPGNDNDETVEDAVKAAGMLGARTGSSNYDYDLDDLQIYRIFGWLGSGEVGTTNISRNTSAMLEMMADRGGIVVFYDHGFGTFSLANWQELFDVVQKSNATVMTFSDAIDYIRTGTDADGDGERWTRTLTSNANYRLQAGSPCRDAGDNSVWSGTANVTDMDGRPITDGGGAIIAPGGTVDMGSYELWPGLSAPWQFMLFR